MPHVEIKCYPGRTEAQKQLCTEKLSKALQKLWDARHPVSPWLLRKFPKRIGRKPFGMWTLPRLWTLCTKNRNIPVNNSKPAPVMGAGFLHFYRWALQLNANNTVLFLFIHRIILLHIRGSGLVNIFRCISTLQKGQRFV